MASQNDPHHQPQTQTPQEDDGDGGNRRGGQDSSTTTTTSFGEQAGHHEGEGSSQHNPASMSVDSATGADFFTLDGMKFDISRDFDGKENSHGAFNVQDFYHDGVFSCEDLYAVVNSSNPTLAVTEVDNASDWHSGSYIPVGTSDLKQLGHCGSDSPQTGTAATVVTGVTKDNGSGSTTSLGVGGMKIPASGGYPSNGSFYRLVTLTNSLNNVGAASMAYSEVDANTNSSATETNGVTYVPSGNTAGNSSMENSLSPEVMDSPAAGTKARKPRGRKPKHVKEAEAAAAAAVAASASPSPAETVNSSPKGTVIQSINLRDRYEKQGDMALKTNTPHKAAPPSSAIAQQQIVTTPRAPPNSPYFPQQQVNYNTGLGSAVAAKMHGTQWSHSHNQPQMSLEQLASHDRRVILTAMRNQGKGISVAEKSPHRHYPHQQHQASQNIQLPPPPISEVNRVNPQYQHRPLCPEQPAPPSPYNHTTQFSARANQLRAKGPLDQLFASRISAPSHRSTVKPNIIQENRRIYNLLTTPTTNRHAPSSLEHLKLSQERWMQYPNPSILDESVTTPSSIQQAATSSGLSRPTYPLPPPPPQVDPTTFILGSGENVNIRRVSDFNPAVSHPHNHDYGSSYHSFTNQIQEMNVRLERLAQGNFELKRQVQYQMKVNRHLMNRLRAEIEDNLGMRDLKYQQSLELNEDGEVASNERRSLREGGILSSYLEEELMCLGGGGAGFGRRRCMRYEDSDKYVPVSGSASDYPFRRREGISGERCSYRRPAPYYRRSSLLTGEHGSLEREMRREGYFWNEDKRNVGPTDSSPHYDNLRKRIYPDTLEMDVANGEGNLNEGEKSLGNNCKNPKNLESGVSNAASQPAPEVTEEVDTLRGKLELSSPTRTNSTDRGSLSSVKSVATELVTPTPTDDSENTSSTVFNSPLKPGNFAHSTGPYFQACDFETFHNSSGREDSIVAQNKTAGCGRTGDIEKAQDSEYAATV